MARGRPKKTPLPKTGLARPDGKVAPFPRERFMEFLDVLRVQSRDYGLVQLKLLGSQIYLLDEICKGLEEGITRFVVLKARQLGISTLLLALDVFWAMEYKGLLGAFVTHEEQARDQFRNQVDLFFQTIPASHKIGCVTNNNKMLVLENASLFRYLVAGTRSTGNKLGRSGGCNYCHSTETAFYGSPEDISALAQTFSEIYPHRLYIDESTANGFNHFYDMWEEAKASPAQRPIFIGWWRNELFEFTKDHPLFYKYMPDGVNTGMTATERKMVKDVREKYGVQLNAGQIAWYRFHLETKCHGDQHQMWQEMPSTDEEAFVATGSQFFTNEAITDMQRNARQHKCLPFNFRLTKNPGDTQVLAAPIARAEFKMWEEPSPQGRYVIGCDPAFGSSPDNDNSIIFVGRYFADCMVQVAEFSSASVQPYECAWILAYIAGIYRDVMVILELNGAGNAVFGELGRLRENLFGVATPQEENLRNCLKYMKEYLYRREDSLGGGLMRQWVTSPQNKDKLMERYKTGFETGRARIRSLQSLDEHRKIVRDEGTIAGSGRSHDDRVIGAALAYWAWDQWLRQGMTAGGRTFEKEMNVEKAGGPDPANVLLQKFLAVKGIKLNDQVMQ